MNDRIYLKVYVVNKIPIPVNIACFVQGLGEALLVKSFPSFLVKDKG
jgi:hypothetical protein